MKLHSLQLTNFRCFESLTVEFDKQLTVLVANNGMGKTAVLEALATGLGVFFSCLPMPNILGRNPKETDFRINNEGKKPSYMRIRLETMDGIAWDRTERRDKSKATLKSIPEGVGYKGATQYAHRVFEEWGNNGKQFPLIAYYGTGRAVFDTPQKRRNFKKDFYINDAYHGALDAKPNFRRFFEFFYFLEDLERREKEQKRDWDHRLIELEIIREAISRMMPGFSNPHSKIRPLRFLVEWHHDNSQQTLCIEQLSDGFRTTLALVMDIASRLSGLGFNLTVDQALNAEGIVLIDEIDLHLHPSWQQRILPDLMRTFPNIQFIVTTHSPQVISTIHHESIRIIGKNAEGLDIAAIPLAPSYGEISSDVLESILFVNPQPPIKERDDLERLTAWVDQGQYGTPDAKALFDELQRVFGNNHPQLQRLQRSIQRQEVLKG